MSPLRLEVFEVAETRAGTSSVVLEQNALEETKLASYEQGYTAGWEDAAAAQSEDQARMRADIARNLQTLGFTFQEARVHVLRAIEPLLQDMVAQLLPAVARAALGPMVLQTLLPLAEAQAETPVTLVLNQSSRDAVEAFLAKNAVLPLRIVDEPSLGEGQVYLRLGQTEARIDLQAAVASITAAIHGFYSVLEEERKHG